MAASIVFLGFADLDLGISEWKVEGFEGDACMIIASSEVKDWWCR
jgi:hypothetical protein